MPARPFVVHTASGSLRALGTEFSVRANHGVLAPAARLAVTAGAVEIRPAKAVHVVQVIAAGWQAGFTEHAIGPATAFDAAGASLPAWVNGVLPADDMPLAALVDQGNGNYSLRELAIPDNPATLSAVTVSAELDAGTEGSGSYTSPVMNTATGLTLSQRQTPQSVSVIGRQQMDDFNLTTLQDVAQATPGIYSKSQAVSDQETSYYARGFAVSQVSVDGLGFDVTGFNERNVSADMVMYDRVEVVRGATGLMQGAGAPAGSINLIRKRPTATPLFNASAAYGNWHDRQC